MTARRRCVCWAFSMGRCGRSPATGEIRLPGRRKSLAHLVHHTLVLNNVVILIDLLPNCSSCGSGQHLAERQGTCVSRKTNRYLANWLAKDANCELEGADCLVVALPRALVNQGKLSGTCALRAEEKPAPSACAGTLLIGGHKVVARGY